MLEGLEDLCRYIHLESAGGSHLSALRRWEASDPEFARQLAAGYYNDPDGWLGEIWREEHRLGWLAFAGEIPAGFLDLSVEPHEALAYLSLYTAPGFRGRGVGGMLLSRAGKAAREDGISGLVAEVEQDNEACARCLSKADFFEAMYIAEGTRTFTWQV